MSVSVKFGQVSTKFGWPKACTTYPKLAETYQSLAEVDQHFDQNWPCWAMFCKTWGKPRPHLFEICPNVTEIDEMSTYFGRLGPGVGRHLTKLGQLIEDAVQIGHIWPRLLP